MKTKYIFASSLLLSLAFTGCQDLDTAPEGDVVTTDQKDEVYELNPERAEASINAIYFQFKEYMPNENALGASRHNDIGYPTIMLCTDANGMDVVSDDNGYNWQGNSLIYNDHLDYTSYECQMVWNDLYNIIFSCNNAIASFDPETDDPLFQMYLGGAYAARAFGYFNLAQLYQFTYVGNQDKPCVPLITNENSADATVNGAPRATVQAVYDQIEADLETGINFLKVGEDAGADRGGDRRYIDQSVAYGIRARVALTKQEWAAAAEAAQTAISLSDARPATIEEVSYPTFWNMDNEPDWMWGIKVDESDNVVSSGIVNWPSHMGSLNYGYANFSGGKQINKALYNTIPDTDVRKGWWTNEEGTSPNLTEDQQKWMDTYYGGYTQVKFGPDKDVIGQSASANDIPLMRIEEMYLILAEAQAMGGDTGTGKATLETLIQSYRDPEYTCTAASAADIQEEIYRQRRIELWGEGLIWYDIMRLNKDVDRRGAGFPQPSSVYHIPAGSDILLWRIPQNEINSNQALTEDDNNKAGTTPQPVQDITE